MRKTKGTKGLSFKVKKKKKKKTDQTSTIKTKIHSDDEVAIVIEQDRTGSNAPARNKRLRTMENNRIKIEAQKETMPRYVQLVRQEKKIVHHSSVSALAERRRTLRGQWQHTAT